SAIASGAGARNTPSIICVIPSRWRHVKRRSRRREKKVACAPERYELHYQDETHVETNPYLAKQWHRIGTQQRIASVGVNRRVTVFGSRESQGRGRIEVVCGGQDSACFAQYLAALDQWH